MKNNPYNALPDPVETRIAALEQRVKSLEAALQMAEERAGSARRAADVAMYMAGKKPR